MTDNELKAERDAFEAWADDNLPGSKGYYYCDDNADPQNIWQAALAWQKSQQAVVSPTGWREVLDRAKTVVLSARSQKSMNGWLVPDYEIENLAKALDAIVREAPIEGDGI